STCCAASSATNAPSISSSRSRKIWPSSSRRLRSSSRGDATGGKIAERRRERQARNRPDFPAQWRLAEREEGRPELLPGKSPRTRRRKSLLTELLPRLQTDGKLHGEEQLVREMVETCLKLLRDRTRVADVKLLNSALRELRYAFKVFAPYAGVRKVSVFGTHDEAYECLTLVQTGKTKPMPIVFVDAPRGTYWKTWKRYVEEHLLRHHLISKEDMALFKVTTSVDQAVEEITRFYRVYHS